MSVSLRRVTVRQRLPARLVVAALVAVLVLVAAGVAWWRLGPDPLRDLPAWNQLDTRWGTYLSERQWGTPHEAVGSDGWGLSYLDAVKTDYRYGEDGIAGLTTRDGAFDIGWAVWDHQQVRVAERLFGWGNPSGDHGEAIVDRRTFGPNTPTSSYASEELAYPNEDGHFRITFEEARADDHAGVLLATARNTGSEAGPLELVVKGWFFDPTLRVELIDGGLLLRGPSSVVAIIGGQSAVGAQASDAKKALDANLRAEGLSGDGPGHIGALDYHLDLAPAGSGTVRAAWAEADDAGVAEARARELAGAADRLVADRRAEADGVLRGDVTQNEDAYRAALMGLLWNQSLYTWDGTSTYDPAWDGKVAANDVLIMPDKWEFPWLATWDTGFQSVAASLIDPQLGAEQLRFLFSSKWQQPDGHLPCAEWVMGTECPPVFAWAALRVADAGAGNAFLAEVYPGLQKLYDYWWSALAVDPKGLFTCGFCGMDNLPRGQGMAQADATAWMARFAGDLATIADRLGTGDVDRYRADRTTIAEALNANLWSESAGFYFDMDTDGKLIPTRSYSGLIPLIAGVVPDDRLPPILDALADPQRFLSPYGVRSVSADSVLYEPGYASNAHTNSNWRGPIWMPINYLIVEALRPIDPVLATTISDRVVATVAADWRATGHFHEYFDAEDGTGLGADAQTGWTALVANLIAERWPASGGSSPAP
jgi:hypothetical protein